MPKFCHCRLKESKIRIKKLIFHLLVCVVFFYIADGSEMEHVHLRSKRADSDVASWAGSQGSQGSEGEERSPAGDTFPFYPPLQETSNASPVSFCLERSTTSNSSLERAGGGSTEESHHTMSVDSALCSEEKAGSEGGQQAQTIVIEKAFEGLTVGAGEESSSTSSAQPTFSVDSALPALTVGAGDDESSASSAQPTSSAVDSALPSGSVTSASVSLPLPVLPPATLSNSSSRTSFTTAPLPEGGQEAGVEASFTYSLSSTNSRRTPTQHDSLSIPGSLDSPTQFDVPDTPTQFSPRDAPPQFDSPIDSGIDQFGSRDGSNVGRFDEDQGDFGPEECADAAFSPLPPDPEESCEQGLDTLCLRELVYLSHKCMHKCLSFDIWVWEGVFLCVCG